MLSCHFQATARDASEYKLLLCIARDCWTVPTAPRSDKAKQRVAEEY